MKIPIVNIYYMLLYAWDALEEAEALDIQTEEDTQLVNLFARVLYGGTDRILRRGLDRGYQPCRERMAGVRGKLCIAESIKTGALWRASAVCEYDELTHDVLHNRIIKSTIRRLLDDDTLEEQLRDLLGDTYHRLQGVSEIVLSEAGFRSVQLYASNRKYRLLIDVCWLIYRSHLATEKTGEEAFRDFLRTSDACGGCSRLLCGTFTDVRNRCTRSNARG